MPAKSSHPSPSAPVVRMLEPRDLDHVAQLLLQCPEAAQWSLQAFEEMIAPSDRAWVVESADSRLICGFLAVQIVADQAEILNLAVAPAARRTGHASALLREALSEFRRCGVGSTFLEVRESNLAAIRFYEHWRFGKINVRPRYYRNPEEGAQVMMRKSTE
jgi:ribosomal-protein-alanine N-acetyltransferase